MLVLFVSIQPRGTFEMAISRNEHVTSIGAIMIDWRNLVDQHVKDRWEARDGEVECDHVTEPSANLLRSHPARLSADITSQLHCRFVSSDLILTY